MPNLEVTEHKSINKYLYKRVAAIAFFWTVIYSIFFFMQQVMSSESYPASSLIIRLVVVFVVSLGLAYMFVFNFRNLFNKAPDWLSFLGKVAIFILASLLMNFISNLMDSLFLGTQSDISAFQLFIHNITDFRWLLVQSFFWMGVFSFTQLYIQINDKYAPGVFVTILSGKYKNPKEETKIVMFMDLKDSTPIAEKLGHQNYFLFIREFINLLSVALYENGGTIYQYVGDEVVVSWDYSRRKTRNALRGIISARRKIQKKGEWFRREFGVLPEFRVGIHVGEVTIGEIGVIKKDLAMSGDTMNTAARIRSACADYNQKFIISKEFYEKSTLQDFQVEYLGEAELKGKANGVDIYALKI